MSLLGRRGALTLGILALLGARAEAECLDAGRIERELKADFSFRAPNGPAAIRACDEGSLGYRLARALLSLRDLPPLDQSPSPYHQNLLLGRPYEFLRARVKQFVIDEREGGEHCVDERLAYLPPETRKDKRIWVCPAFARHGLATQLSTLVHEARHEEGEQYQHRPCRSGPYLGRLSCDDAYADGGSYAVGLELLVKLARAPELPAELRAEARRAAIMDFLSRFNRAPLPLSRGALLQRTGETRLSFFDGERETTLPMPAPEDALWALQGGLPLYFSPSLGEVGLFAYAPRPAAPVSDVLTKLFTKELSSARRAELRDVLYGDQYACLLLRSSLDCFGPDRRRFPKALGPIDGKRFLFARHSRVLEPGQVALLGADGTRHRLPFNAADLEREDPREWVSQPGPFGLLTLQSWAHGEIGLGEGGELVRLDARAGEWREALPGTGFRALLAPFTYMPSLNDL